MQADAKIREDAHQNNGQAQKEIVNYEMSGTARAEILAKDAHGKVKKAQTSSDIELSGGNYTPVAHHQPITPAVAADSVTMSRPPSFGATVTRAEVDGKQQFSFKANTTRIASKQIEGKLVEVFLVRQGGSKNAKPVGIITMVDGLTTQYIEYSSSSNAKKVSSARVGNVDRDMRATSEVNVDLRSMKYTRRGNPKDVAGTLTFFGRMMHGIEVLVLPDALNAMELRFDHPCHGTEVARDLALIAFIGATANAAFEYAICQAGVIFVCPDAVRAAIAAAALGAAYIYIAIDLNDCLVVNPEHCGEFEDNPCGTVPQATWVPSGGGASYGDEGDPGTGGGATPWNNGTDSSIPSGFECDYWETSQYNYISEVWEIRGHFYCHSI